MQVCGAAYYSIVQWHLRESLKSLEKVEVVLFITCMIRFIQALFDVFIPSECLWLYSEVTQTAHTLLE